MQRLFFAAALAALLAAPVHAQQAGAAAGATGQVSVTTATAPATLIAAERRGGPGQARANITVINITGSDKLCVGFTSAVTATTGQCLPAVAGAAITLSTTSAIYGVVATTAQTVSFSELY